MCGEVTICSVITPFHAKLIITNYQLISRLNTPVSWKIVYNDELFMSTSRKRLRIGSCDRGSKNFISERTKRTKAENKEKFSEYLPKNSIVDGLSLQDAFARSMEISDNSDLISSEIELRALKALASYHHAFGLELGVREAKTRFVVIIDPDFFVIQPDWINRIVGHMTEKKLAVFGASWNPAWYQKLRDFPCSHLMIIDRERVTDIEDVFIPDLIATSPKFISPFWADRAKEWKKARIFRSRSLVRHPWQALEGGMVAATNNRKVARYRI